MSKPLSPQAQAVRSAVMNHGEFRYDLLAAAALRAAADQVVPHQPTPTPGALQPGGTRMYYQEQFARWEERQLVRRDLLAIASDLEAGGLPAVDDRDAECVARWPDCINGGYDPKCCRSPKSCSCGGD